MPITVNHSTPADGTFSATGATAWDANHTLTGVGTLAEQNANAVAITGGTINGTTIGATTPSTVNATTITGQTGVLRGTGNNLLLQSQTFTNANWVKFSSSVTANTVTAPDSTLTGSTFTGDGASSTHRIDQGTANTMVAGYPKTFSIYAQKGTNDFLQIYFNGDAAPFANFNLNTGTVGSVGTNQTASIVNAGGGWYRLICFTNSTTAANPGVCLIASSTDSRVPVNTLATTVFLWGAQGEIGSTANTYIPTTTTAVYGTPTLSFSGVSTIGLESNGSLFVQPAGTGALQAQATTSTTAGGNARGANAVDWQTSRGAASQVASGQYSIIGGGIGNTSNGVVTTVAGGNGNVVGGIYAGVLSGISNTVSGFGAAVVTGYTNTAAGHLNFIGGGFTNSGTANAAVTTQSGTMNGTTAVTLSGSNANIKVGQYITGTSIATFPSTYVAAISGTSLTLSQNASGSSTSTLSFFTPHGVVVGGGNNQATGSYSFIGGGGDAGTAANRNVASGDWSVVGGGRGNTASGIGAFVGGGGLEGTSSALGNTASGLVSFIGGGLVNQATSNGASILGGYQNTANGQKSTVVGGSLGTTRGITANIVFPASNQSISGNTGVTQAGLLILGRQTTDATATALTSDPNAAGTTNQVILPNNSAYFFTGEVVSGVTGGGNTKGWTIEGVIKRGANAASTALVGTPTVTSMYADVGASTWVIAVTADTTNGGIRVTFTGQLATTIRTVCQIRTTEMTY
jgi:hypothetical protein